MEEKNTGVQEKEIDLRIIFDILKKNIIPIILVAAIFAAGFFAYSKFFIPKQYEATASLIVNNKSDEKTTVQSTELMAARNLAEVYSLIIKSDEVLSKVIEKLGLSMSTDTLSKKISVSTVESTQVIKIAMRDTNPDLAMDVVAQLVATAPPIIQRQVEAGSVKPIDDARLTANGAPVSPNSVRNGIIGGLIGLVLMLALVFVRELSNNTFKSEDDISKTLNIPLLGIIPSVDTKEFNKSV